LDRAIAAAGLSIMWSLLTIILFLLYAEPLISLFLSSDEPARLDILAVGVVLLAVAAVFQLVDGGQVVAIGLLRGLHDTTIPMVIAIISYWPIGLGASYVFGFVVGLGAVGVWIGLVVGLASAAIALIIRFVLLFKRFPVAAA
jgi:MATE family multidrug resistance protein